MLSLEELKRLRDAEASRGHGFNADVLNEIIEEIEVKNTSENTGNFIEKEESHG